MTRIRISFFSALVLATTTGCAAQNVGFVPLGSHTLRVASDQEVDVVWLVKDESKGSASDHTQTVLRCRNAEQGPLCEPAKIPQ